MGDGGWRMADGGGGRGMARWGGLVVDEYS